MNWWNWLFLKNEVNYSIQFKINWMNWNYRSLKVDITKYITKLSQLFNWNLFIHSINNNNDNNQFNQ